MVQFNEFLDTVDTSNQSFVNEINDLLTQNNCKCIIKPAKSGFLVSYVLSKSKKTIASFVNRKSGMKLRIYPQQVEKHLDLLNTLPNNMKKDIKKSTVCKRLVDPDACNPKCVKGYDFLMDNDHYQKCRYMAFMFNLSSENNSYIKAFLEHELQA